MLQSSDLWCWMIWNGIFDFRYNYYGHASAAYWVLQLPRVEQMTTAKEFIIHRLVLYLNHLDRVCKDLRFKIFLAFSIWTCILQWYYISWLFFQWGWISYLIEIYDSGFGNVCKLRLHLFSCYPFDDCLTLQKRLFHFYQNNV